MLDLSNSSIYMGNCLDILKDIPNESIDLIVTDPPYKVTSKGNSGTMGGYWTKDITNKGKIFTNNNIKCSEYLPEFYRVLKDKTHCYVMCNNINLLEMITEGLKVGFNFVKCLIWEKNNKICGRYYMNCFEYIILFRKGGDRPINDCGTPDILNIPIHKLKAGDSKTNLHDTEKPVELMKVLIKNSSNENDIVLEPFMGIGSTCIAAKHLNRKYIGIEIDEKYFKIAGQRIKEDTHLNDLDEVSKRIELF